MKAESERTHFFFSFLFSTYYLMSGKEWPCRKESKVKRDEMRLDDMRYETKPNSRAEK